MSSAEDQVPEHDRKLDAELQEALELPHSILDKKCSSVLIQLWPRLKSTETSDKSSPSGTLTVRLLKKLLENYSHVHQLQRLVAKMLEALRQMPENPDESQSFPTVLFEEVRSVFTAASEQQMLSVWTVLVKEAAFYATVLEDSPHFVPKLMTVVRLIWITLKYFRIRNTTRQEIIQNTCRLHLEMREVVIESLMDHCKRALDPDIVCCCLVLVHSWISFPVVLRDKIAIPLEEGEKLVKQCNRRFKEFAITVDRPDLFFWMHQLAALDLTVMHDYQTSPTRKRALIDAHFLFCWEKLDCATESCSWDGNPFDISVESFPVAIWSSICSHYAFLMPDLIEEHSFRFSGVLVRTLVAFGSNVSIRQKQHTLRTVSDRFLRSGLVHALPSLGQACMKTVENMMRGIVENEGDGGSRPSKNKKLKGANENRCEQLLRTFHLCERIGFGSGSPAFSFSLIWRRFEFFLKNQKAWPEDLVDTGSVLSLEKCVMDLVFSVATNDPGFWISALFDLENVRPLLLEKAGVSKVDSKMLDFLQAHEYRLLLRVADLGGVSSLADVTTNLKTAKKKSDHLYPVLADVLLARIQLPKAAAMFDEVIPTVLTNLEALVQDLFAGDQVLSVEQTKLLGDCIHSTRTALQKFRSSESFKKRAELIAKSTEATLTKDRIKHAWDLVQHPRSLNAFAIGIKLISLSIEVLQTCKTGTAKKILAVLAPAEGEPMDILGSDDDYSTLDALDEAQLLELLQVKMDRLRSSENGTPDAGTCAELVRHLDFSKLFPEIFLQMIRFTKPSKMAGVLYETGKHLAVSATPSVHSRLLELTFYDLVVSAGRFVGFLPEELRPLFELLLQRLGNFTAWIDKEKELLRPLSSLLIRMLKSSYAAETTSVALSEPIYRVLLQKELSDEDFTHHFVSCATILNTVMSQQRLLSSHFVSCFTKATSLWLIGILQRARQEPSSASSSQVDPNRKIVMIRNASFVERVFGNMSKHQKIFSKLVIHLIAVYCAEMQNGTLHPEAKEHVTAGLYRLLDIIDPHSKLMGNATIEVGSREIYKNLLEDHMKFHKYRGLV